MNKNIGITFFNSVKIKQVLTLTSNYDNLTNNLLLFQLFSNFLNERLSKTFT